MRGGAHRRATLVLSGPKVGDLPCKTGAEDHHTAETFAARQRFNLDSFRGPIPAPLTARRQGPSIAPQMRPLGFDTGLPLGQSVTMQSVESEVLFDLTHPAAPRLRYHLVRWRKPRDRRWNGSSTAMTAGRIGTARTARCDGGGRKLPSSKLHPFSRSQRAVANAIAPRPAF